MTHQWPSALQMEAQTARPASKPASVQVGRRVRRADGRVQTINRVLRSARSGRSGTSVEIVQVELTDGHGGFEYVDHYPESARLRLASLTGRPDYPAAEFLAAVED